MRKHYRPVLSEEELRKRIAKAEQRLETRPSAGAVHALEGLNRRLRQRKEIDIRREGYAGQ